MSERDTLRASNKGSDAHMFSMEKLVEKLARFKGIFKHTYIDVAEQRSKDYPVVHEWVQMEQNRYMNIIK
ncbi:hypothetical protein NV379_11365 [Paenibacillus sp. N1-5-1-14]|nr:hypothetical protein [Paenibacillus radicibacter]